MLQVKIREKGQITIPAEVLQEWRIKNQVNTHDVLNVSLSNGVLMLVPSQKTAAKRDMLSFAGSGKGLWGQTEQEIESSISEVRKSWSR
jgi:bifunctional DNA-binding transcriptional regulator/antitoxin component of YhaV-PrlF toxin-antitoxin module